MKRRDFFSLSSSMTGAALLAAHAPGWAQGASARASSVADRVLVLIELKGGNDGLNTVVPYTDSRYYELRNTIAVKAAEVLRLDDKTGLHPALGPLLPLWEAGELGIVQSVGYPQPNLSHFRSIEIWETASKSPEYLNTGWTARAMAAGLSARNHFTAEGVSIGDGDFGVLAGARAISLNNAEAFVAQSVFAHGAGTAAARGNPTLRYLLQVEDDINRAAEGLRAGRFSFATPFPAGAFGSSIHAAAQVVASQRGRGGVPVITLTLGSFDTHQGQAGTHAHLLRQLGEGMAALKASLTELGTWDRTLVMTFSEFGRRARQNSSNGTDHGTAAPHFVAGGAVRGGLYGTAPDLLRLEGGQNIVFSTDFRQIYATVARDWWGVDPQSVVRGTFDGLGFLRA